MKNDKAQLIILLILLAAAFCIGWVFGSGHFEDVEQFWY
jgi:hypothetical protein